ncbi:phage major capsid protein [Parvibaculum sp.]|uniref:phage major capsid protein n=1 Tax=Parvibaculum sp. TaxID=2024848 RepID=UPI001B15CCBF|nr:phage major capsid protein [Parvibaculum sp.]MBO6634897.1 phage major capsid protein [Parvibaculum sp.]MBO6678632.1 phage major capsid protein [Parvibaculum sp.]MBO6684280.1 phage major capsid protein [Parvibaculum sp.]MBO6905827.1 phage major capsid protein [Parvibaculum sp.]
MSQWNDGVPRIGASLKEEARAPETKSGEGHASAHEVREAMDEFLSSFEEFKSANDERLGELERKLTADVIAEEKVERINRALDQQKKKLDELTLAAQRPDLGGRAECGHAEREHKRAFEGYVRKGEAQELRGLEAKALSMQSDPDGGYLVPAETERMIERIVSEVSPIRAIAGLRRIGAQSYKKPFSTGGAQTGWVGETEARPQTATPSLAEIEFPAMELYAMPAATPTLLDDAAVNIDQWLAEEVQTAFVEQEGAAFVNGDGVKKPRGFLDYDRVADGAWEWGKLGFIATGNEGGFPTSNPGDKLIDLVYAVKSGYRTNGRFVMNRTTQAAIRKFKDTEGNYLWQPALAAGQPPTLLNYPVTEAEDMPSVSADAPAVAFGDFRRGYLIVDRVGVRVLRDPYSAKPYVLFYTTKRVGGGVQNFEAIKFLQFSS